MIHCFNPAWYYQADIGASSRDVIRTELVEKYLEDDFNFSQPPGWTCDVLSTHTIDNPDIPWDILIKELLPSIRDLASKFGLVHDKYTVTGTGMWANKYKKGMYQEPHTHPDTLCNLVGVYFYTLPKDSGNFLFYDETNHPYKASGLSGTLNLPTSNSVKPEVRENDVILFPPHYTHHVTQSKTTEERLTISFNLFLEPKT